MGVMQGPMVGAIITSSCSGDLCYLKLYCPELGILTGFHCVCASKCPKPVKCSD